MKYLEGQQSKQKLPQQVQFLVDFLAILRVGSGTFWCEWEGYESVSSFESPIIIDWCFIKNLRWLNRYQKSQVVHNAANWQQLLASLAHPEKAIWSLFGAVLP